MEPHPTKGVAHQTILFAVLKMISYRYIVELFLRAFLIILFVAPLSTEAVIINIEDYGAVADDESVATCFKNSGVINRTLAALKPGDTMFVPNKLFWLMGGIYAKGIKDAKIQIDGTLKYWTPNILNIEKVWPRDENGNVKECMYLEELDNVTFTSSGRGTIDGNGHGWWGAIKYLLIKADRPRLVHIQNSQHLVVEHLHLKDSPRFTFLARDISDLTVRYTNISARRTNASYHDLYDLTAFNTDGFDVAGKNVHIHDCNIWNDDDCIAVKQQDGNSIWSNCSENMLFERINASGLGLTIGSIGATSAHSCVRNITFKDSVMVNTVKGIYLKSRPSGPGKNSGEITNVTYQNITIITPTQWAIWIGPQQAIYEDACSLLWPEDPFAKCPIPSDIIWTNIVLRDIRIISPKMSPGVILGNSTNPMRGVVFDNVVVTNPGENPWGDKFYACEGTEGVATGTTSPVPPCFTKKKTAHS